MVVHLAQKHLALCVFEATFVENRFLGEMTSKKARLLTVPSHTTNCARVILLLVSWQYKEYVQSYF